MIEIVNNIQEIISKEIFPKILFQFGPRTSSWPQKQHFKKFEQILQISASYSTITLKLPP